MLGTGVRIGESLAVLWFQVDLEAGTVEITDTIARITGEGLIRKRTKSRAGQRLLHLPRWAIAMLRTRHAAGIRLDDPVFADVLGGFRDPSNTRRTLRTALSPVGSTARRDLGLSLRALRRETGLTRKQVANTLNWPQTRIELARKVYRLRPSSVPESQRPGPAWWAVCTATGVDPNRYRVWFHKGPEATAPATAGTTVAVTSWAVYVLPPRHLDAVSRTAGASR